eukprot:scaffold269401_cov31-Tisochrysis_lutea.AAC.2
MLRIVYVQSWRRKAAENSFDRARVSLASLGLRQVDELPILVAVDASYCTPLIGLSRRGSPHYFQAFEIRRVSHNLEIYRIRIVSLGPVLFLPLLMLRLVRRRLASQLDPCGPVGVGLMVNGRRLDVHAAGHGRAAQRGRGAFKDLVLCMPRPGLDFPLKPPPWRYMAKEHGRQNFPIAVLLQIDQ